MSIPPTILDRRRPGVWTIGQLARQSGLTVRTLRHYDQIGLLSPARRSDGGYRLYGPAEVLRLQQIRSLRQLGVALADIRDSLDQPSRSPLRVIEQHLAHVRKQIQAQRRLCERLERIGGALRSRKRPSAEDLFLTIQEIDMLDKYYAPEQLRELEQRRRRLGEEHIREVEAEWPRLIEQVRTEMRQGTDPASPTVQRLARRWRALIHEFTGGNPEIEKSLSKLHQSEPDLARQHGSPLDPEVFAYISRAIALLP